MHSCPKHIKHLVVKPGAKVKLDKIDPRDVDFLGKEEKAREQLAEDIVEIDRLQDRLYAEGKRSILVVLQGTDTAGKDGTIRGVFNTTGPLGVSVTAFKKPSEEELAHDYLWRVHAAAPRRGTIGIFNRSHYEEVLVTRVHPDVLAKQRLPKEIDRKDIWRDRFDDILAFERHLARNGTLILKFCLNISRTEQRKRFLQRIDDPSKRWKFSMSDVTERELWPKYMAAYEEMIRETSVPEAPWFVVPADNKWFTRMAVAAALVKALDGLKLEYPKVEGAALKELQAARKVLESERDQ